jgi:hypothetical protein
VKKNTLFSEKKYFWGGFWSEKKEIMMGMPGVLPTICFFVPSNGKEVGKEK